MKRGTFLGAVCAFLVLAVVTVSAQSFSLCSSTQWSQAISVSVDDQRDLTIIAFAYGIKTITIADPTQPEELGKFLAQGELHDVAIQGHYVFLACDSGLSIVDVAVPENPHLVSRALAVPAYDIVVRGHHVFLACGGWGIRIVDVTDPYNPVVTGSLAMSSAQKIVLQDSLLAWVVDWPGDGLVAVNVADPYHPTFGGGNFNPGSRIYGVAIVDTLLYYTAHSGLFILNVLSPQQIRTIGLYPLDDNPGGVAISGNYAYVAAGFSGLEIIDISNPSAPTRVSGYSTSHATVDVRVSGGFVYLVGQVGGLNILSVIDPALPSFVGHFDAPGYSQNVYLDRHNLRVCDFSQGLYSINVSNVYNPWLVSNVTLGECVIDVAVDDRDRYAYVAQGVYGLNVISLEQSPPCLVTRYNTPGSADAITVCDSIVYVGDMDGGVRVISCANPAEPVTLDTLVVPLATAVSYVNEYLYVSSQTDGLYIFDAADPGHPFLVGHAAIPGTTLGQVIIGSYAYVANWSGGCQVVEITNPSSPTIVATIPAAFNEYVVDVCYGGGNIIYFASWTCVEAVDISDPLNPRILSRWPAIGYAVSVDAKGGTLFVSTYYGVIILRFDPTGIDESGQLPTTFSLAQNYPNPFNAATMISYALPEAGETKLEVYDILGRLVATPVNAYQLPGQHQAVWDASQFASGVYLYRLSSGKYQTTVKMTVLK